MAAKPTTEKPSLASIDKKLAVMCVKIDNITSTVDETKNDLKEHLKEASGFGPAICDNKDEIDRLRKKNNAWDVINSAAIAILTAVGVIPRS